MRSFAGNTDRMREAYLRQPDSAEGYRHLGTSRGMDRVKPAEVW